MARVGTLKKKSWVEQPSKIPGHRGAIGTLDT